jgi:putative SOS response-associated peptidase YedK
MCSEYTLTASKKDIEESLGRAVKNLTGKKAWDQKIGIANTAPLLTEAGLIEAVFPVRPFPNARLSGSEVKERDPKLGPGKVQVDLKRIYERKAWQKGFIEGRRIAVMSTFREPAYWGENQGSVMEFSRPGELLFVPAIQIKAQVPPVPEAFALLTHTASEQMLEYHQRLLVLLKPEAALEWLAGGKADPEEKFEFLLQNRYVPKFEVTLQRRMAAGWKSRVLVHEAALRREQGYLSELKRKRLAA